MEQESVNLQPLIEKARKQNKWLHCGYQDLWFSPDELEAQNKKGKFLWGEVNWDLRNPQEHIEALQSRIAEIGKEISAFQSRIHGG
jgi:hypothetical protein